MSKVRNVTFGAALALLAAGSAFARNWLTARPYVEAHAAERTQASRPGGSPALPKTLLEPAVDRSVHSAPDAGVALLLTPDKTRTPPLSQTTNYLLVGTDKRADTGFGGLPDTLIVAAFDRRSGHVGLVSVPRDLYVLIPDHGPDRINATFTVAYQTRQSPTALLERVIEDTLALPISHTVAVDIGVFERAVDALGGLDVVVNCPIVDDFIDQRTATGRRVLDVQPGIVHMDGTTASMYVRSRHGRSDYNRARRQQAVLAAIRDRFTSIDGLVEVPQLWSDFEKSISTDMRRLDVFRLAERLGRVDPAKVHGLVLAEKETRPYRTAEGRAVLLPDFEAIDSALGALFSSPAPGAAPPGSKCAPAEAALKKPRSKDSADAGAPTDPAVGEPE
jgi:LCP family protein required for cell wall assembly